MRAAWSAGVSPPHKRASDDAADDKPSFRGDFVRRHFVVEPNELWVADIHFLSIFAGFLYLTVLLHTR